jgi:hypothetical protein
MGKRFLPDMSAIRAICQIHLKEAGLAVSNAISAQENPLSADVRPVEFIH